MVVVADSGHLPSPPLPDGPLMLGCMGIISHAAADYIILALQTEASATLLYFDRKTDAWSVQGMEGGSGGDRQWAWHKMVSIEFFF